MKIATWLGWFGTGLLAVVGGAASMKAETPPAQPTLPQIVRLSYAEGDVRVSPGAAGEKATGNEWETAKLDVPLYSGFSLVTGAGGRAEIEFEDATYAYLGENSVLSLADLSATAGHTHTELALVSGVMTLVVQTLPAGDMVMLRTPVNSFMLRSPTKGIVRVNSYLDAMELTPIMDPINLHSVVGSVLWPAGKTMVLESGNTRPQPAPPGPNAYADWDAWVTSRAIARNTAMNSAMKDAGLSTPIPGLTEIAAEGSFFDCAPYGKCWVPKDGWDGGGGGDGASGGAAAPANAGAQSLGRLQTIAGTPQCAIAGTGRRQCLEEDDYFPCSPAMIRNFYQRDPVSGKLFLVFSEPDTGVPFGPGLRPSRYLWGVCHTGTWIRHNHRYAWVAGTHRHHRWGVRWVKVGSKTGFVPVHPHDVNGKPPVNIKHGVYMDAGKKDHGTELVKVSEPVKLLDSTPKEYAKLTYPALPRAEAPHMEARDFRQTADHRGDAPVKIVHPVLTFDHKTGSFNVAHTVIDGGHERQVTEPVGGRGGMERGGGTGFNNGSSGGSRGSESSGFRGSQGGGGFNSGATTRSFSGGGSEGAHSAPSAPSAPSLGGSSGGTHH